MNRRDLIKAALTLPILNATRGWTSICSPSGPCPAPQSLFQLYLEGPFGLILHKDTANPPNVTGITAFMPVDPSHRHHFAMQKQPQDIKKEYSFALTQTKPPATNSLCIDSAFGNFCVDSTSWSAKASSKLLTIELAVPTRIIPEQGFPPMPVVFKSSGSGNWQRAFVLEYDLNVSPLQLTNTTTGANIPLTDPYYRFEVGLSRRDPDKPGNPHAKDFYNRTLLSFFPDLQKNDSYIVVDANDPSKPAPSKSGGKIRIMTSTYECKSGGIIGGTP